MADTKISELVEVVTPASTDVIPIVSGGSTKKVQVQNLTGAAAGALLIVNNLDDLDDVATALVNLGVGPRNTVNGYAGLDGSGLITESQIPSSIARDSETTAAVSAEAATRAAADAALQPLDGDLTAIAALSPTNDDLIQRKAGAWTNRTPAQVKTDLVLVKGDVGLGNVDNTSDSAKPISTATQTALDLKAPIASPTFTGTVAGITKSMVGLGNVDNTSDANKPVSTATQTALDLKANDADVVHDTGAETIAGVKTFSSDPIIPDEAYGVGWNGSLEPPTKNAVYDKIETLGGGGGTPGGSDTQVQFNDSSAFGGDAQFTFNKTSGLVTHTGASNDGAALANFNAGAGASFTRINNNGTVVIDGDVGTGTFPLTLKYNGSEIFSVAFSGITGTVGLTVAGGVVIANSSGLIVDTKNILLGNQAVGTGGTHTLVIKNGTPPGSSPADAVQLYAEDIAGSSELKVRDEAGNITPLSPHNFSKIPEGPSEEMAWAFSSERNGKYVAVDMLRLARLLEKLTGEKLVYTGDSEE